MYRIAWHFTAMQNVTSSDNNQSSAPSGNSPPRWPNRAAILSALLSIVLTTSGWVFPEPIKRFFAPKDYELKAYYCADPVPRPYVKNMSSGKLVPVERFNHTLAVKNRLVLANTGQKTLNGIDVQIVMQPAVDGEIVDIAVLFESGLAEHELIPVEQGKLRAFVLKLKHFNPGDEIAFKVESLGLLTMSATCKSRSNNPSLKRSICLAAPEQNCGR